MGKRQERPDLHDFGRRASADRGLPVDPDGEVVEIENTLGGITDEIAKSLADFRQRGCACNPDVVARFEDGDGGTVEGKPVLHTYFIHEDWCPFLRMISEGSR